MPLFSESTDLCPDMAVMALASSPALCNIVIEVARMQWFIWISDNSPATLILFIISDKLFLPTGFLL
jgi:hypothetical protein